MLKLILITTCCFCVTFCDENDLIVETPLGKIEGYVRNSFSGRKFIAFEGVPYAEPPVGDLRFEEPRPVSKWKGVWKANTLHQCIQYYHYTEPGDDFVIGQEDCLYLNIYTPSISPNVTSPFDVIIFIHGGAFMFNHGGSYGPNYILDRDVVYVSLNYRLGPLGFLSTGDDTVPGNNGLRDQLLALKWIERNVIHFNGNPGSVTLTGMSAGGASVHFHLLSPLSKGLFHRGIIQSGTALSPWSLTENLPEKTEKLSELLGCSSVENKTEMIRCLKTRPAYQLVNCVKHFLVWLYNPFSPFGAVVDKWSRNPFLPEHPIRLLKEKKVSDVPAIFSNVESEGSYPAMDFIRDESYLREIDERWNELIPFILDYNNTVEFTRRDRISQAIRKFYFGDEKITFENFPKIIKMISDRMFLVNIQESAQLHSSAINSPVHHYYFSYRGAHSKSEGRSKVNTNYGAAHGDDTVNVLSSEVNTKSNEDDRKMSEVMIDMWINFAADGSTKLQGINWLPLTKNTNSNIIYAHVEGADKITLRESNELGNNAFWNGLDIKNEKLFHDKKIEL